MRTVEIVVKGDSETARVAANRALESRKFRLSWEDQWTATAERGNKTVNALAGAEPVKPDETTSHVDLMSASGVGSLIQAMVGSSGGVGRRCRNRAGLAA